MVYLNLILGLLWHLDCHDSQVFENNWEHRQWLVFVSRPKALEILKNINLDIMSSKTPRN